MIGLEEIERIKESGAEFERSDREGEVAGRDGVDESVAIYDEIGLDEEVVFSNEAVSGLDDDDDDDCSDYNVAGSMIMIVNSMMNDEEYTIYYY